MGNMTEHQVLEELKDVIISTSAEFGDALPENTYWTFSFYTTILPAILAEIKNVVVPQSAAIGSAWNYLDATCSLIVGVNQLTDETTHRPVATKIKGTVNISSAIQLSVLTSLSFGAFGGIGFAAAFGAGFLLSLDDLTRTTRCLLNRDYWLKDSLAQLEKLNKLIPRLENAEKKLKENLDKQGNKESWGEWALERKRGRLKKAKEAREEIEDAIIFRTAANHYASDSEKFKQIINHYLQTISPTFQETAFIKNLQIINTKKPQEVGQLHGNERDNQRIAEQLQYANHTPDRNNRENQIMQKNKDSFKTSVRDTIIWAVAFTGVLLACIPGLQLPALILVSAASFLYFNKNKEKIYHAAERTAARFKLALKMSYQKISSYFSQSINSTQKIMSNLNVAADLKNEAVQTKDEKINPPEALEPLLSVKQKKLQQNQTDETSTSEFKNFNFK
ncbi:MAG: hypothetical protein P4M14_10080 [Gammaproteobacteria bacterium]|nr:hypothetical protein [Gammaproteobacteria bacterium]